MGIDSYENYNCRVEFATAEKGSTEVIARFKDQYYAMRFCQEILTLDSDVFYYKIVGNDNRVLINYRSF